MSLTIHSISGRDVILSAEVDRYGLQVTATLTVPAANKSATVSLPVDHSLAHPVLAFERSGLPTAIRNAEALIRATGLIVPITMDTANAVNAYIADIRNADPRQRMEQLIAERARLYEDRAAEMDRIGEAREQAFERDSHPPTYNSPRVQELTAAIAAWETAHPDVMTEIARRRDERIDRNLWM